MALPDKLVKLNEQYKEEYKNSQLRHSQIVEAAGEAFVNMGGAGQWGGSTVSIAVFDAAGLPVTVADGTALGSVLLAGATKEQDFSTPIVLGTDEWSWAPQIGATSEFKLSITGLTSGYFFGLSIGVWGQ